MGKYKCASDSLRPGQLDRMISKIKDKLTKHNRAICSRCKKPIKLSQEMDEFGYIHLCCEN